MENEEMENVIWKIYPATQLTTQLTNQKMRVRFSQPQFVAAVQNARLPGRQPDRVINYSPIN